MIWIIGSLLLAVMWYFWWYPYLSEKFWLWKVRRIFRNIQKSNDDPKVKAIMQQALDVLDGNGDMQTVREKINSMEINNTDKKATYEAGTNENGKPCVIMTDTDGHRSVVEICRSADQAQKKAKIFQSREDKA